MMGRIIIFCLFMVAQNLVNCQVPEQSQYPDPIPTSTHDPYANVLSQLSDVIFDVEDRLYRLTAPKDELKKSKTQSGEEKDNHRRNYFDRIRDNYKTLQDQVGQSLSSGGMIKMADILNLNFQNKGSRSSLDLSLPFLPLNIKVDAKKPPTIETGEKTAQVSKDGLNLHSPFSDVSGNIDLGIKGIFDKETSDSSVEKQKNLKPELQKRSSRPIRSASTQGKNIGNKGKSSTELYGDYSKSKIEQPQDKDRKDGSGVEGRILGDLLFSESTFDQYFRQTLKDHGKWLVDSEKFLPPKKIIESIRGVTRDRFTASTSSKSAPQGEISGVMSFKNKEQKHRGNKHSESWRHDADPRIVLAFTPQGLPLKLKIGHTVNKPLKFLHQILSEAGVSLNIPVSSTDGIQPAGNGVLHLGFEDRRVVSRTPLLDLSDDNQLSYLLKTLNKLKYEHY